MSIVPVFLVVLFIAWRTVHCFKICCGKRVGFTKTSAKMNATRILASVVFVMYPGLSVKCFRVFNCMEINGKTYLMADLVVSCDDESYERLWWVALSSILIYVLGVPFTGFLALYRWKSWLVLEADMSDEMHDAMMTHPELRERHHRIVQEFGTLFISYRPVKWWYEMSEMLRKAMMTGMLTALPGGIFRNAVSVVVCVFWLGWCASHHPFRLRTDYYLQLLLLFMLFASFYANLLISGAAFKRAHEQELVGEVLITGNTTALVYGGIVMICMAPSVRRFVERTSRPFRKALDDAITVLDEDGDGDVSIFEVMTASSAKRNKAIREVMHGASETLQNVEHAIEGATGIDVNGDGAIGEAGVNEREKKSRKKGKKKEEEEEEERKDEGEEHKVSVTEVEAAGEIGEEDGVGEMWM